MKALPKKLSENDYHTLVKYIKELDYHYYIENQPLVSDYEYDQYYKALIDCEQKHPEWLLADSPTQVLKDSLHQGFSKKNHVVPMLSLANTYSYDEVAEFFERVHRMTGRKDLEFVAELKMDGLAISLTYENHRLTQALTRGDGKQGDDITQNALAIHNIVTKLPSSAPSYVEVRAEVFMPKETFYFINAKRKEQEEEEWANPRNAAAGSLKLLDRQEVYRRNLCIMAYDIVQSGDFKITSQNQVHGLLKKWAIPHFKDSQRIHTSSFEELKNYAEAMAKMRDGLSFAIDGIVIKVDDTQLQELLSNTAKTPRWAVAYKFKAESAVTKLHTISLQVGRTGVVTPVAELDPVVLAGSKIRRATLHNFDEIDRKDLREGDTVVIEKGGDVIPKVVSVQHDQRHAELRKWQRPTVCPSCGTKLVQQEGIVAYRCPNKKECPAQNAKRLEFFASKNALDIEHLGPKVMQKLALAGLIQKFSDVFCLEKMDLLSIEGFKDKSADNLLKSIEKTKSKELWRYIHALGIPFVGKSIAELIAVHIKSLDDLLNVSIDELMSIDGIGEKVANSVLKFVQHPIHRKEIEGLLEIGLSIEQPEEVDHVNPHFTKKTFVLTGTLDHLSREEAATRIKRSGGKVTSSVSKNTDCVVVGRDAGSKYTKAQKLGVECVDEETLLKWLQYQ